MAEWTCFSCGVVVEYAEPVSNPRFLSELHGRTKFLIDGVLVHECVEGDYHPPKPTLRRL